MREWRRRPIEENLSGGRADKPTGGGTAGNDDKTIGQDDLEGSIRMRRDRGARTIEWVAHLLNLERPTDECDSPATLGEQMPDDERTMHSP